MYTQNGQYELHHLTLTSKGVELDLKQVMLELVLYESVFSPVMTGQLLIADTQNLFHNMGLGFGDALSFSFNTTGFDKVSIEAVVYKISAVERVSEKSSSYILHFASKLFIDNLQSSIVKSYKGTPHEIVQRLIEDSSDVSKQIKYEQTRNIEHYVFTHNKLFDAIALVARQAVGSKQTSGFVFFENNQSINFKSLDKIMEQEPVIEYRYKSGGVYEDVNQRFKEAFDTYQDYKYHDPVAWSDLIASGHVGQTTEYFSIGSKTSNLIKVDHHDLDILGDTALPIDYQNHYDNYKEFAIVVDHSNDDFNWSVNKLDYKSIETQTSSIVVFGNSNLKAGDIVGATLPVWSHNNTSIKEPDKDMLSGKFVLGDIKHVFKPDGYSQVLKLVKNSYEEQYGS